MYRSAEQKLPDPPSTDDSGTHEGFLALDGSTWREALPAGNVLSIPLGHLPAGNSCQNWSMDDHALREKHVKDLIRARFKGKKKSFAEAIHVDPTTVSRWLMRGAGRKNIGEKNARNIEDKLSLERFSLDLPDGPIDLPATRAGWPFSFPRSRYDSLSERQKLRLDGRIEEIIHQLAKVVDADQAHTADESQDELHRRPGRPPSNGD